MNNDTYPWNMPTTNTFWDVEKDGELAKESTLKDALKHPNQMRYIDVLANCGLGIELIRKHWLYLYLHNKDHDALDHAMLTCSKSIAEIMDILEKT